MMFNAAYGGHEHLCRLAKEWGVMDYNGMMFNAAYGGHEHLCRLAKEWGATDYNGMMMYASLKGHESLCHLAKEWGATDYKRGEEQIKAVGPQEALYTGERMDRRVMM
jgi:dsRNA-specific ribonuclease